MNRDIPFFLGLGNREKAPTEEGEGTMVGMIIGGAVKKNSIGDYRLA